MKLKKVLSLILCVAMLLGTMSTIAFADASAQAADTWDGTADTSWYNDTDTEFTLNSAEALAGLAQLVDGGNTFAGKTVKLASSIDLYLTDDNGNRVSFEPIGDASNADFSGVFDGNNNTIFNLYQDCNSKHLALFGAVYEGTVKNLTLDGARVENDGSGYAGAIASYAGASNFENITLRNTTVVNYNHNTAGIVAWCSNNDTTTTFDRINIESTVTIGSWWGSYDTRVGGIIGAMNTGNNVVIKNSNVACELDVYNDITSNYQWGNYRTVGMLIADVRDADKIGDTTYALPARVTVENVKVTIGEWANYHYCEDADYGAGSYNGPGEYKYRRVEAGLGYGGIDLDACNHADDETHNTIFAFNTLFGVRDGKGLYSTDVKTLEAFGGEYAQMASEITVDDQAKKARSVAELWVPETTARAITYVLVDSYETLEEAIADAQEGYMVKLTKDIEIDASIVVAAEKDIILDLNGHTISMEDSSSAAASAIKNNGNLTITDSSEDETGKITFNSTTPSASFGYTTSTIVNTGNLTVESGTIENTTNGGASYAIDTAWYTSDTSITINGGTITSERTAVRQVPFSTTYENVLTINSGTIIGGYAAVQTHGYTNAENLATVNINGGTLDGQYAYYTYYSSATGHKATDINIAGGTFDGYVYIYNANAGSSDVPFDASITNGEFSEAVYVYTNDADGNAVASTVITNGKFKTDASAYVSEDSEVVKLGDDEGYEYPYIIAPKAASAIKVEFAETDTAGVYDIVLVSADGRKIHEFVSAEFTFSNTSTTVGGSTMQYAVSGIEGKTTAQKAAEEGKENQYIISIPANGERLSSGEVTKSITIGQVKFIGQGTINFSIANGEVDTTWQNTNLGRYYYSNDGTLDIADADIENGSVEDITRDVVVKVTYNHDLVAAWDNNEITVTLKDGFGEIVGTDDISDGIATFEDVRISRITVTLEAPGFRKYVYETTLEEGSTPLVLNFWNDVKKDAYKLPIETGKTPVAHNFVVGDIVMDYIVDKYDLAAVTSYYGMYDIENNAKYLKYDLNRDGNIDIRDVQYVLHTMGN